MSDRNADSDLSSPSRKRKAAGTALAAARISLVRAVGQHQRTKARRLVGAAQTRLARAEQALRDSE